MSTLRSLQDLWEEASRFVKTLTPDSEHATLVTLSGELGAGKTTFTQAIAKILGVEDTITSPTFVLEKVYALRESFGQGFTHFVHIDAYRLKDEQELRAIGFSEVYAKPQNLIFLEWPENVERALPRWRTRISLTVHKDGTRNISYE